MPRRSICGNKESDDVARLSARCVGVALNCPCGRDGFRARNIFGDSPRIGARQRILGSQPTRRGVRIRRGSGRRIHGRNFGGSRGRGRREFSFVEHCVVTGITRRIAAACSDRQCADDKKQTDKSRNLHIVFQRSSGEQNRSQPLGTAISCESCRADTYPAQTISIIQRPKAISMNGVVRLARSSANACS